MTIKARSRQWALLALLALLALNSGWSRWLPHFLGAPNAAKDQTSAPPLAFPLKPNSVRFAVIGDSGTGDSFQKDVAQKMIQARAKFPFDFVVMLGDNIYGGHSPQNFTAKFEQPYKALLNGAGVKFYACLGNHD